MNFSKWISSFPGYLLLALYVLIEHITWFWLPHSYFPLSSWYSATCLSEDVPGQHRHRRWPRSIAACWDAPVGAGGAARRAAQEMGLAARPEPFPREAERLEAGAWPYMLWNIPLASSVSCPGRAASQLLCTGSLAELKSPWLSVSSAQQHLKHQCTIDITLILNPNHSPGPGHT